MFDDSGEGTRYFASVGEVINHLLSYSHNPNFWIKLYFTFMCVGMFLCVALVVAEAKIHFRSTGVGVTGNLEIPDLVLKPSKLGFCESSVGSFPPSHLSSSHPLLANLEPFSYCCFRGRI